jgi:hypothetical protein
MFVTLMGVIIMNFSRFIQGCMLVAVCIGGVITHNAWTTARDSSKDPIIIVGDTQSKRTWVFLCGVVGDFMVQQAVEHRVLLDRIGKKLGIAFVAVRPKSYTNYCGVLMLCWPHNTQKEILQTYQEIQFAVGDRPIAGYIGFSNGGFFLNKLAQYKSLEVPIISIGSAGYIDVEPMPNTIHLLIGIHDVYHYEYAQKLYAQSQNTALTIKLIEYDGGHDMSETLMTSLIAELQIS